MIGIICLLLAITVPPLQVAHQQAMTTTCAAQLQQIGHGLQAAKTEYNYYPVWDDNSRPVRFTWVDVLVQRRYLSYCRVAYCPSDPAPGLINSARGLHHQLLYPSDDDPKPGIDYSYGINAPLSAGAWSWHAGFAPPGDPRSRRLEKHERWPAQRVLSADANWSVIYNLSGDVLLAHDWSYPTQYDNTVDWRHPARAANALFQDGHVDRLNYNVSQPNDPVNTSLQFIWHPGESFRVGPEDEWEGNYYPNVPPVDVVTGESQGGPIPRELVPGYYTRNMLWTRILHK